VHISWAHLFVGDIWLVVDSATGLPVGRVGLCPVHECDVRVSLYLVGNGCYGGSLLSGKCYIMVLSSHG
jgi:hypothetical protein